MSLEQFMRQMADQEREPRLPGASAVWWRAEFRRRLDAERRAALPFRIAASAAYAACAIAAVIFAARFGAGACIAAAGTAALSAGGALWAVRAGSR